jgi:hypothetical protein
VHHPAGRGISCPGSHHERPAPRGPFIRARSGSPDGRRRTRQHLSRSMMDVMSPHGQDREPWRRRTGAMARYWRCDATGTAAHGDPAAKWSCIAKAGTRRLTAPGQGQAASRLEREIWHTPAKPGSPNTRPQLKSAETGVILPGAARRKAQDWRLCSTTRALWR